MNHLQRQLYKSGWFKLAKSRIDHWGQQGKVDHLIFVTQEGQFDLRLAVGKVNAR